MRQSFPGIIFIILVGSILPACSGEGAGPADGLGREALRDDEAGQAALTRQNFQKLVEDYKTSYVARGAHAKAHSCVRAYFDVHGDIQADYRYGVFSRPGKRYKSWVRFSNGHYDLDASQDYRDDARGLAVKLMEISGQPLERSDVDTATQDFLMTNSPVFFVKNMPDYNQLVANPGDFIGFFFPDWNPFNWRIKELLTARKILTSPPDSLLTPTYYSITPYKLGPHNIKFGAKPCAERAAEKPVVDENTDPDYLRKQLQAELSETGGCFIFQAQKQQVERGMSLDDATEEWSEEDSPFMPLATITIPRQDFSSPEQLRFCENLSYAPWHALPEHRPLGQLNRLRRHAYPASSDYRHRQNQTRIPAALAYWRAGRGSITEKKP